MSLMMRRRAEIEVTEGAPPALTAIGPVGVASTTAAVPFESLWRAKEKALVLGLDVAALSLVVAGAIGAGGIRDVEAQMVWVDVAVLGAGLPLIGHSIGYRLARSRIRRAAAGVVASVHPPASEPSDRQGSERLVATVNGSLYHATACPFAMDKPIECASRANHEAAGRRACEVCQP